MRSRLGFSELTAQCVANASKWTVGKGEMTQAANEMARELEAGIANMSKALQIVSGKIEAEQPLNGTLSGIARGGAHALSRTAGLLGHWGTAFQKLHAPDIARQTNPRPNEEAWNVTGRSKR